MIFETNISRLNLWSRYSTSKHASELVHDINEEVQNAPDFGIAFDGPTPELGAKFNLKGSMDFDSRLTILNGVVDALKDDNVTMCSICGMGGVGKTTLAKNLVLRVEADRLFDKVAMVTVSQNVNLQEIQNGIIEQLRLKIDEGSMPGRASKLNDWLTKSKSLLILDDVWWQLNDEDFENIGIPLAFKGCKIVITSRNEDECKKMGSQQNFLINVLTNGEAWHLFRQKVGKCVEDLNLQKTAREIVAECDGLPIAIVTIAKALEDKPKGVWKDSLLKLQKSNLVSISGMEKVYSRIQLSYDLLNDQEAQVCFRLCCLFPEDYNVPIEYLVRYGKGLRLFENVETMSDARDRVESIIHKLKKSFLLFEGEKNAKISMLECENNDSVKMHDILRDFAISLSSKDKHPYIVGCEKVMEKWPETGQYEHCSAISFVCDKIKEHPVNLRCPKLEILQLILKDDEVQLPISFFEGLKELKVLVLKVSSLVPSLTILTKLRTLTINMRSNSCKIGDIIGRGDLKDLEILAFVSYGSCHDFPEEIGLLCNLRCLKLRNLRFEYMPPSVLSNLVKLEELELSCRFISWGCKEKGGERVNASLDEIQSLPLTTLKLSVAKGSVLSEKLVKSLTRFCVSVEDPYAMSDTSNGELKVRNVDACDVRVNWISGLLRKSELLSLSRVRDLKNITCLQSNEVDNGFPQLENLSIDECNEMEYLVDAIVGRIPFNVFSQLCYLSLEKMDSLKEILPHPYFSKIESKCFSNLISIFIVRCPKLKRVFPLSVATELRQLQRICIYFCAEVEEVFYTDQVNDGNRVASTVQLSTPTVERTSTPKTLNPITNIDEKPQPVCPTPNSFIRRLLGRSEKHPKMIKEEDIANVEEKEVDDAIIVFPKLDNLHLVHLDKLKTVYDVNHSIEMPSLEELTIRGCTEMEALSYGSLNAPRIKEITIHYQKYLVAAVAGEDLNAIVKKMTKVDHWMTQL